MNIVTTRFSNDHAPKFGLADEIYLYLPENLEHRFTNASFTS